MTTLLPASAAREFPESPGPTSSRSRLGAREKTSFDRWVEEARSPVMRDLLREVDGLGEAECPMLILGETGTGKSVLARRLHELSSRVEGPFVDVNCAGFSRELVESELFGHERGAFTGAHTAKQGLFEAAHGGTLLLDEIGDIDIQVQPRVLKVLEERRFRRIGDVRERQSDVRLIAATHRDLLQAVAAKEFRADLFYRISVVTITVPPLRERSEDLLTIAANMLFEMGAPGVALAHSAEDKLLSHRWPGNLRELRNVLQRALLLSRGRDAIGADAIRVDSPVRASFPGPVSIAPTTRTLEDAERGHIVAALLNAGGRVARAARYLGVPRSTLYHKIKAHGIALPFRNIVTASPSIVPLPRELGSRERRRPAREAHRGVGERMPHAGAVFPADGLDEAHEQGCQTPEQGYAHTGVHRAAPERREMTDGDHDRDDRGDTEPRSQARLASVAN